MALPSLADVVFIIVLLIPGFITLVLFRWIAILERKLSDYELVIWSVFLSLLIYSIVSWHTGVTNIDNIRDNMLLPENLLLTLSLSLLFGVGTGYAVKFALRKNIIRGDSWQVSMKIAGKEGAWVIIYTTDDCEYKGALHYFGGVESPKEVSIREPILIVRDKQMNVTKEIPMGEEILFSEKNIARVVFFKKV